MTRQFSELYRINSALQLGQPETIVEGAPLTQGGVICFPSLIWFRQVSRSEAPVGRRLTFVPGNVSTRIHTITV
jgi:hypothetical protein